MPAEPSRAEPPAESSRAGECDGEADDQPTQRTTQRVTARSPVTRSTRRRDAHPAQGGDGRAPRPVRRTTPPTRKTTQRAYEFTPSLSGMAFASDAQSTGGHSVTLDSTLVNAEHDLSLPFCKWLTFATHPEHNIPWWEFDSKFNVMFTLLNLKKTSLKLYKLGRFGKESATLVKN